MEKVILTKEQAEAIEQWVNKGQLIVAKAAGLLEHGKDEPIDKLTMEEIVKAIYIGYEVEPEFVSFEEAMKALKEAKAVYFHDEEWKTRVIYGAFLEDTDIAGYTLAGLINGKWSIGRENK